VASSVFGDREARPDDVGLVSALGPASARWRATVDALEREFDPLQAGWSYSGKAYGWSLRCSQRGRPVVYLTPLEAAFRASFALPERAMPAALDADLPAHVREVLESAPIYAEGRGVRLAIASDEDIASLVTLLRIRMAS
jgi:hypothetical protein